MLLTFLPYSAWGWKACPCLMSQTAFLIMYFLNGLLDSSLCAISSHFRQLLSALVYLLQYLLRVFFCTSDQLFMRSVCVDQIIIPCFPARPTLWISTFISFSLCNFALYQHLLHSQVRILQLLLLFLLFAPCQKHSANVQASSSYWHLVRMEQSPRSGRWNHTTSAL